jgi:hypothetical protein
VIEIFILVLAVGWIARIARTRDTSPWVFGSLAVLGFFVFPFLLAALLRTLFFDQLRLPSAATIAAQVFIAMSRWLWVGAIALYVSRVPGRERVQPPGRWSCRGCGWLNDGASLKCDACGNPCTELAAEASETTTTR